MEKQGNKIIVTFDYVAGELKPFDVDEIRGFTIAGEDRKFVPAQAKVLDNDKTKVEVWSDQVANPSRSGMPGPTTRCAICTAPTGCP